MLAADGLEELSRVCEGAQEMVEGGRVYVYLPSLKIPTGGGTVTTDGLLCLCATDGYPSRLFLSQQIQGRGNNWSTQRVLDRTWYTWSWNWVSADMRPVQVLAEHLRALR